MAHNNTTYVHVHLQFYNTYAVIWIVDFAVIFAVGVATLALYTNIIFKPIFNITSSVSLQAN